MNPTIQNILQLIGGVAVFAVAASIVLTIFSMLGMAMLVRFFMRR